MLGDLGDERDVLARGQAGNQIVELEHEADVTAAVRSQRRLVGSRQVRVPVEDVAARRHVEPAEDVQERGLAGPRRTQQHDEMSFVEHEADLAEGMNLDLAHAIHLRQLANIEDRGAHLETHRNRSRLFNEVGQQPARGRMAAVCERKSRFRARRLAEDRAESAESTHLKRMPTRGHLFRSVDGNPPDVQSAPPVIRPVVPGRASRKRNFSESAKKFARPGPARASFIDALPLRCASHTGHISPYLAVSASHGIPWRTASTLLGRTFAHYVDRALYPEVRYDAARAAQ